MRTLRFLLTVVLVLAGLTRAQEITSPEKFFGFQLGTDKKMARWDKIVQSAACWKGKAAGA